MRWVRMGLASTIRDMKAQFAVLALLAADHSFNVHAHSHQCHRNVKIQVSKLRHQIQILGTAAIQAR